MNSPDTDPHPIEIHLFGAAGDTPANFASAMILTMLEAGDGVSDLIFSLGRPAQVESTASSSPSTSRTDPAAQA